MNKAFFIVTIVLFFVTDIKAQYEFSVNDQSEGGQIFKFESKTSKDLIKITHSDSIQIISGNSSSCNINGIHSENGYWRVFKLAQEPHNITTDLVIVSADVAVESISGSSRTQTVIVKLYTLSGVFSLANLTLIYSEVFSIENDASGTIVNLPLTTPVTVPVGSTLVYELLTPDGEARENSFFIGSNTYKQSDLSYISAPDCGITEPISTSEIGYPGMHIVLNLWGEAVTGINEPESNVRIYPNPSDGIFNIQVDGIMNLEIFDISGKIIKTQIVNGTSVSELYDPGIYFFKFSNKTETIVERLIVK